MRKAFTGGACQDSQTQGGMGANAMTNFAEQMIMGGANASQQAEGYHQMMTPEDQMMRMQMDAQFNNIANENMMQQ